MKFSEKLKKGFLFFDGGTGTVLQSMGLKAGEAPEEENERNPDNIINLHKSYIEAGADIIKTNTFGLNHLKFGKRTEKLAALAVSHAKRAVREMGKDTLIAFSVGPLGKLLKPFGDLEFEEAVEIFSHIIKIGSENGVDIILIETMNDSYETKAAVLAAKESCGLPVFVSNVYDENGKLMTGCDAMGMVAMLEGLGVSAIGMNCGFGPDKMEETIAELYKYASVPIIVNPNAGLPKIENGKTVFSFTPEIFSEYMKKIALLGGAILGGCCGTTPEYIRATREALSGMKPLKIEKKNYTLISSYTHGVVIGKKPLLIGERINPTGKPRFKEALRENNMDYILNEAVSQQEKGVHILDVNVGLPEISEPLFMEKTVKEIQTVSDLPLQIDSSDYEAIERALRVYNGKSIVNSVNGKKESMEKIFPLIKKYGGVCVALCLDEKGIPENAEGRIEIAKRIYKTAEEYGIDKKDIVIDTLVMTVSSDSKNAISTLKALKEINDMGGNTVLGVSNISFGLPKRELINSTFFTLALQNGLSLGIINPYSDEMLGSYKSFLALLDMDENCMGYIGFAADSGDTKKEEKKEITDLKTAIIKGFSNTAETLASEMIKKKAPLDIINEDIIPALDFVGKGFEEKRVFLPSLLMSAEASKSAFSVIKNSLKSQNSESRGKILLATVKDDIHDIGKNIVKVLLENYGFTVLDLGKDVEISKIVKAVKEEKIKLVGLSALMTTTVPNMEKTISALREAKLDCSVMVGGAVLTKEYADMIGADNYSKDAMEAVRYAEKIFS